MIVVFFKLVFGWFFKFPVFWLYYVYDLILYVYRRSWLLFHGWGIHLFVGAFGKGKTMLMCIMTYLICKQKKQVTVLTNLNLTNFPKHTRVLPLRTAQDILKAPKNCIVLIDEIGTIFNSRDFSGGKAAVPKPLFQLLCQCRKRRLMIFGTVQRYNLLDKQIRDIAATVTECTVMAQHPFSRMVIGRRFDIEEYDYAQQNRQYIPKPYDVKMYIQSEHFRHLYDTTDIVAGFLNKEFLSDQEILQNQAASEVVCSGGEVLAGGYRRSRTRSRRRR